MDIFLKYNNLEDSVWYVLYVHSHIYTFKISSFSFCHGFLSFQFSSLWSVPPCASKYHPTNKFVISPTPHQKVQSKCFSGTLLYQCILPESTTCANNLYGAPSKSSPAFTSVASVNLCQLSLATNLLYSPLSYI